MPLYRRKGYPTYRITLPSGQWPQVQMVPAHQPIYILQKSQAYGTGVLTLEPRLTIISQVLSPPDSCYIKNLSNRPASASELKLQL